MATFTSFDNSPETIKDFDDEDDDCSGSEAGQLQTMMEARMLPTHLLVVSLLDHLSGLYVKDPDKRDKLFKKLCQQLASMKMMSPVCSVDELSPVRSKYKLAFSRLVRATVTNLKLDLPVENNLGLGENAQRLFQPGLPRRSIEVPLSDLFDLHVSRYRDEFHEFGLLGKGGYGSVYKVVHRLDGCQYAVKKIYFKETNPALWFKLLREVKYLASQCHENIVRYYGAWTEYNLSPPGGSTRHIPKLPAIKYYGETESRDDEEDSSIVFEDSSPQGKPQEQYHETPYVCPARDESRHSRGYKYLRKRHKGNIPKRNSRTAPARLSGSESEDDRSLYSGQLCQHKSELSIFKVPNTASETNIDNTNNSNMLSRQALQSPWDKSTEDCSPVRRTFSRSVSLGTTVLRDDRYLDSENGCGSLGRRHAGFRPGDFMKGLLQELKVVLYIQMQLCGQTLRDWLLNRNAQRKPEGSSSFSQVDDQTCNSILEEILKGIHHIHSQGLLHRDIKPRNIFLQPKPGGGVQVKVGDFGLAREVCEQADGPLTPHPGMPQTKFYTSGVGTTIYAAPEQLSGSVYDCKSDMYSVGLILFELYQPFGTEMEKVDSLNRLRAGELPEDFVAAWPVQAKYIKQLTNSIPSQRLSAEEVLDGQLFASKEQVIKELQNTVTQQQTEIQRLRSLLANAGISDQSP